MDNLKLRNWGSFFSLSCLLLVSGCTTTSQKMSRLDESIGSLKYSDAVSEFGKPVQTENLDQGAFIATWLWDQTKTYQPEQFNPKQSTFDPTPLPVVQRYLVMNFNRNQVMQSWRVDSADQARLNLEDTAKRPEPGVSTP